MIVVYMYMYNNYVYVHVHVYVCVRYLLFLYRDNVRNFFKNKSSEPVKYERVSCDSHVIVA